MWENGVIPLIIMVFLIVILGAGVLIRFIAPFVASRNYIKMELNRTIGKEHKFWERELKKLYLYNIPVLGVFFRRKNRKKRGKT